MYVYHGKSVIKTLLVFTSENYMPGITLKRKRSGDLITNGYNVVHSGRYCARHKTIGVAS